MLGLFTSVTSKGRIRTVVRAGNGESVADMPATVIAMSPVRLKQPPPEPSPEEKRAEYEEEVKARLAVADYAGAIAYRLWYEQCEEKDLSVDGSIAVGEWHYAIAKAGSQVRDRFERAAINYEWAVLKIGSAATELKKQIEANEKALAAKKQTLSDYWAKPREEYDKFAQDCDNLKQQITSSKQQLSSLEQKRKDLYKRLGLMHFQGHLPRNDNEIARFLRAIKWMEKAANVGSFDAMNKTGCCYLRVLKEDSDLTPDKRNEYKGKVYYWLQKAASGGHVKAQINFSYFLSMQEEPSDEDLVWACYYLNQALLSGGEIGDEYLYRLNLKLQSIDGAMAQEPKKPRGEKWTVTERLFLGYYLSTQDNMRDAVVARYYLECAKEQGVKVSEKYSHAIDQRLTTFRDKGELAAFRPNKKQDPEAYRAWHHLIKTYDVGAADEAKQRVREDASRALSLDVSSASIHQLVWAVYCLDLARRCNFGLDDTAQYELISAYLRSCDEACGLMNYMPASGKDSAWAHIARIHPVAQATVLVRIAGETRKRRQFLLHSLTTLDGLPAPDVTVAQTQGQEFSMDDRRQVVPLWARRSDTRARAAKTDGQESQQREEGGSPADTPSFTELPGNNKRKSPSPIRLS